MKQMMITAMLAGVMAASAAVFGEDAYIESDGTQFLNTGYCVCTNTRIEIDFQMMEIGLSKYILAAYNGNRDGYKDNLACEIYLGGNNGEEKFSFYTCTNRFLDVATITSSGGLRCGKNLHRADTNRHVIVVDFTLPSKHYQVWNGTFTTMLASWTVPEPFLANHRSTVPLALFGRCFRPSGIYNAKTASTTKMFDGSAKARVYSLKIYEGGTNAENLVMHLVPHVKGGVAGFKDLCKPGRFVQGEIDGACTAGGDVTEEPDDLYIYTPRNTLSAVSGKSVFLDTGYTIKPTTRVELDFAMLTANWATNCLFSPLDPYIIGAHGSQFYFYADGDEANRGYFRYAAGGAGNLTECGIDRAYNIRRTVSMNSNSVSLITAGYTNWTAKSSSAVSTDLTSYTLKIGASFTGKTRFLPMKVYGLKIFESDVLVKDYLPFYSLSDGVAGFTNRLDVSDILTSRTLTEQGVCSDGVRTNAVFEVGGAVTANEVEKEAYLDFRAVKDAAGNYGIDTGLYMTSNTCVEVDFSLWNSIPNQDIFAYGTSTGCLYVRFGFEKNQMNFYYWFHDYNASGNASGSSVSTGVPITNNYKRMQFKLDGYNKRATLTRNGVALHDTALASHPRNLTDTNRRIWIGTSYSGITRPARMKLYRFKVSEEGRPMRDFVPCTHDGQAGLYDLLNSKFYPLTTGKVYGKGYSGQSGTFEVALPQAAKITKGTGPCELACIAPGASSFEWYEDGRLIEGATTDSYTVQWTQKQPHVRTYRVVPVYTVFNEKVKGEAATATVELSPVGFILSIQ